MKEAKVLVVGYGHLSYSSIVAKMVEKSTPNCKVQFVGDDFVAMTMLKSCPYQIVICDFFLGSEVYTGVQFFSRAKARCPEIKTILLAKDFQQDCAEINLADVDILRAVDCIWEQKPRHRNPLDIGRIKRTVSGLLEKRNERLLFDELPFFSYGG